MTFSQGLGGAFSVGFSPGPPVAGATVLFSFPQERKTVEQEKMQLEKMI